MALLTPKKSKTKREVLFGPDTSKLGRKQLALAVQAWTEKKGPLRNSKQKALAGGER